MRRAWQVPEDVRTVHLGALTPAHAQLICDELESRGLVWWAKEPGGFFTRIWEHDVHIFVDRTKVDEARAVVTSILGAEAQG